MSTTAVQSDPHVAATLSLWDALTAGYGPRDFALRCWDGTTAGPDAGQTARFTVALTHAGALRQMFWPFNHLALGEAYIYGDFDIVGDTHSFVRLLRHLITERRGPRRNLRLLRKMLALPNEKRPRSGRQGAELSGAAHSTGRDRQAISYHYDLPDAFYALWLDRLMMYTCGYYCTDADDLDTAQEQKVDLICRKLRLRPGERLLDIGCGWGGMMTYAAKKYGVEVVGVTLSDVQAGAARRRIKEAGVEDRCRVELCDYRDLKGDRRFDKAASVGLCEHLGLKKLPGYFAIVYRLLRPGGVFLNQHITMNATMPVPRWRGFVRKYVFPDGELQPISDSLRAAEAVGFEVRDVECLREHYIRTLEHWAARLEMRHDDVVAVTDEVTYRIYRLYLAGAASGFRTGLYGVYQSLMVKPDNGRSGFPPTRADWYA
jgi:cyclopropane-fatty-acyl-phospholipid synthase